jgi:predicted Zn-dependent protease
LSAHDWETRVTRGIVAVLALVVLAWLGMTERNLRLQASGVAATAKQDFARAQDRFARSSELNPDTTPDLQRAYVLNARGDKDQAIAAAREILRREPENRDAWGLLLGFVADEGSPLAQRARAEVRRLNPLAARR